MRVLTSIFALLVVMPGCLLPGVATPCETTADCPSGSGEVCHEFDVGSHCLMPCESDEACGDGSCVEGACSLASVEPDDDAGTPIDGGPGPDVTPDGGLDDAGNDAGPVNPVSINSFSATIINVDTGSATSLVWTTSNADSCTLDEGQGETPAILDAQGLGSREVSPTSTTTYTLSCSG
ncbi:MAG: hypothetical protein GY822_25590, partial [Deltaproteobacteria bacterium]|nr:hypothetical protein [Deltaproteobacteria bacterium]